MSEAENKLLVRRFIEEVGNTGAVDRLPEFFASEFKIAHTNQGLSWYREHILTFHKCYPDLVITVDGQVAEGDIVVTWGTLRGTHSGDCAGVRATHKRIVLHAIDIHKFRNGRIVEQFGGSNSLEALMELGLVKWASGQPGALTNGDPAALSGNSEVTERPPSVT